VRIRQFIVNIDPTNVGPPPLKKKIQKFRIKNIKNICEQFHSSSTQQFLKGIA